MGIDALSPHGVNPPFYDPWSPLDPPSEKGSKIPLEYSHSTIKQAKNADDTWAFMYPEVAGTFLPQQHQTSIDPMTSRPKIEVPNFDSKKLKGVDTEVEQLVAKIGKSDDAANSKQEKPIDKNLAEIALLQTFIQCMKLQKSQNEQNAEITFDIVQKKQDANSVIKKEYFNALDDHIAQNSKSELLSWVSWILYGALAVVGLASLALTITASVVTGGAALPLALTVTMALVNGILAVASGSTSIFKGVLDYNNKKTLGVLEEKKYERILNTQKMKAGMDEMRQSMEVISEVWKELIKVVNNWTKASLEKPH
jgi:hypothetical protein